MNPKVSIIIPAYNAEATLPRLIDCVLSQTEKSWELVLIDDGSRDTTPAICDQASSNDSRIRVIHQPNAGISDTRNRGISEASGEWIAFVDADDLITDTFLSSMLSASDRMDEVDMVYCGYYYVESNQSTLLLCKNRTYIGVDELSVALSSTQLLQRCCPWARMYRRRIIIDNNIKYDKNLATEDRTFNYEYLRYVRGIATTANIGYIYGSFSPTSLKHKKRPLESMLLRQQVLKSNIIKLRKVFDITNDGLFIVWRNYMTFLLDTMECVYYHEGRGEKSEQQQRDIFDSLFNTEINDELKNNLKWKAHLASEPLLQMIMSRDFARYNRVLEKRDFVLKVKQMAWKLLRKEVISNSYETAISMINE